MSSSSAGQRFADYFVVSGLDITTGLEADQLSGDSLHISPLERSYKAKVLVHFPSNVDWNPFDEDAVRMLSLPQGLTFKKQSEHHEPSFHSFLITREDGSRVYGCALKFYEIVKDSQICKAMDTLQAMHDAELALAQSRTRSKSLSLMMTNSAGSVEMITSSDKFIPISEMSTLSNHRAFDVNTDTLLVSKSICIIMPLPFISAGKAFLEQVYCSVQKEDDLPLPLESYIYNLLFEVPLPPSGKTMRFSCNDLNITCQRPSSNEIPLFDYSSKELFSLLGVENIVKLFTCCLLEQQILLISNDFHKFMLVAESMSAIIFPFIWQHVYVPILPPALSHFLDAPVPFLMGIYCASEEEKKNLVLPSEASLCLVDIDNCTVTTPEDLPVFPDAQELIEELNETVKRFSVRTPQDEESSFTESGVSLENSLEIPHNCSSNGNSDYETASNSGSPQDSPRSRSPCLEPPSPRSVSPNIEGRKVKHKRRDRDRMKASRSERKVPRSKSSTSLDVSKNPRLQAIAAIAERTGIIAPMSTVTSNLEKSVSDTQLQQYFDNDNEFIFGEEAKEIPRSQQHENEFNTAVREIFANRFTQLLLEYESFVIHPNQDLEDWTSNREQMHNFDKASFLSDQPQQFLPFLSPFTETQMFASFIDMKIMGTWGELDSRIAVFDQRVDNLKTRLGVTRSPSYEKCMTLKNAIQVLLRRSNSVDHMATQPHKLDLPEKKATRDGGYFMALNSAILNDGPNSKSQYQSKVKWRKNNRKQQQSEHISLNTTLTKDGKKMRDKLASSIKKYMQESKAKSSQFGDMELTHTAFIQKLLKECKTKIKKILVQKMGQEAVDLGHSDANVSGVEENTLIASLCDLLERIWSHGLQTKEGKSALWSHLLAFQLEFEGTEDLVSVQSQDSNSLSPMTGDNQSPLRRRCTSPDIANMMQSIQVSQQQPTIASVLADMSHVQKMTEIRTDIGHARAWIRLALEKKVLSKHLKQVLSSADLLRRRYKEYAFLRTDEEKEQFLYHLLSLTAVDFFCFTNGFQNTAITYKVVIKTGKQLGGSTTTAQVWMTLAGNITDTGVMNIPKNENEFRFQHTNLGVLTTLRIGHDNSGYSAGWFIEQIIIKNEVTSHIYRFPCGRWLAKNMDDGSTERLLVAELMKCKGTLEDGNLAEVCRLSPQRRSPVLSKKNREKIRIPEVQERVADAVNNIVKHFYRPEKERGNLTYLLCGDGGLCQALEQVFQCGFRSSWLFRNNFFIWDILEKGQQYLSSVGEDLDPSDNLKRARKTFCTVVTRINNASHTIGKDGKFQSFVCLGARDHLLHDWFELLSTCPATTNMYDTPSFFRDSTLVQFLVELLQTLVEFNITLEASLLKGIS
ncbi:DENN domain-containing protein 5B-like [Acropora millepora]|uniref:DENN domain-containing protein 5B-like n=1 Tax=Acropora millepora TaxID=45264 RepID=UPI001CF45D0E|nr:DENN domain-containing protein 5B-like [Acropora millepora]